MNAVSNVHAMIWHVGILLLSAIAFILLNADSWSQMSLNYRAIGQLLYFVDKNNMAV